MKTTRRFSPIELMTVVAIVMTLFSVLLSSIKTSKDLAIRVSCMSNISQIRNYTELYRKDHQKLPYSEIWLTDFSFVEPYTSSKKDLEAFTCPGSEDPVLLEYSQLKYNTSYYYVPNASQWEKNIEDGQPYGIDSTQVSILKASENAVIYDKSPDHHNGAVNIARLYKADNPEYDKDGEGTIISESDNSALIELAGDTTLDLPEVADLDIPEEETPVADEVPAEEEPPVDDTVDLTVDEGVVVLNEPASAEYKLLGAAISYGGQYDMPVTNQIVFRTPDGKTDVKDPFGDYGDPIDGNCNVGTQKTYNPPDIYPAGTEITARAKSWKKRRSSYSGSKASHWTRYLEMDSNSSRNLKILRNGNDVPQIPGFLSQGSIEQFVGSYIQDGKIVLEKNQAIFLFELGTTNLSSSAADFQDLVLLVTFFPEASSTTTSTKSNNGHGNNVDGVDSSNPGNAPFTDSDPTVDDENK